MKGDKVDKYPDEYCDVCMECSWWWREASVYGESGEWVCAICSPKPRARKVSNLVVSKGDS